MSLIGSLEDLDLGDILQIISLSQKSGVLFLQTDEGEGRILLRAGSVAGASVKGGPQDLRGIILGSGLVSESEFDEAADQALSQGVEPDEILVRSGRFTREQVDSLCREAVESAAVEMFSWNSGEFSFDLRSEKEAQDPPALVPSGISAQYLAMEGARRGDEALRSGTKPADVVALAVVGAQVAEELFEAPTESVAPGAVAVILIDPDLTTLEWAKTALEPTGLRVHIFQRQEQGLARIRQYLGRAATPCVLVAPGLHGDPMTGVRDADDFIHRLKRQAPRMPVLWLRELGEGGCDPGQADGVLERPRSRDLASDRPAADLAAAAEAFRERFSSVLRDAGHKAGTD